MVMDAINSLSLEHLANKRSVSTKRYHKRSDKTQDDRELNSDRKIIKHNKPSFNKAKILAKIKAREKREAKKPNVKKPDSPLLKNSEDNKAKLKKMLQTPGAMVFNPKEREILNKILNKEG
jgi:hypothetical protein